jgi:hypothetical protein
MISPSHYGLKRVSFLHRGEICVGQKDSSGKPNPPKAGNALKTDVVSFSSGFNYLAYRFETLAVLFY